MLFVHRITNPNPIPRPNTDFYGVFDARLPQAAGEYGVSASIDALVGTCGEPQSRCRERCP